MAECKSCGEFVTDDYVRVFGDNDGNVFDCRNCRARSSNSDDEEESEERVLLREVTGTDATDEATGEGSGGATASGTGDASASETGVTASASPDDRSGSRATDGSSWSGESESTTPSAEGATDHVGTAESGEAADDTDGERGGARERLAGLFSSLRG